MDQDFRPWVSRTRLDGDIRSLTGIRGIAAVSVVFYHYFQQTSVFHVIQPLIDHGYIAVDLFFVLSGFVMTLSYGRLFSRSVTPSDFLGYMLKRIARVYPLYIVITLATGGVEAAHLISVPVPGSLVIMANLLMMQAWDIGASISGPAWSISTEFGCYLIFPGLVFLCAKRRGAAAVLLIAAVLLLCVAASQSTASLHQLAKHLRSGPLDVFMGDTIFPFCRTLGGFTLGMLAATSAKHLAVLRLSRIPYLADALAISLVVLLALTTADVAIVVLFVPLVLALAHGRSIFGRFLSHSVVYWLGLVSYSVYLVHQPAEWLLVQPFGQMLGAVGFSHAFTISRLLAIAATLGVAAIFFYGLERPARDILRRTISGAKRSLFAEPSAPRP